MIQSQSVDTAIVKTFHKCGYKATPQRIAIGKYVLNTCEHPTAKTIYQEIRKTHPTVSLATIYTTLKVLKDEGLIQELNMPQGQARFDPNTAPHVHLICMECGGISDWLSPLTQDFTGSISEDTGCIICSGGLDINVVCKECQENGKGRIEKEECGE